MDSEWIGGGFRVDSGFDIDLDWICGSGMDSGVGVIWSGYWIESGFGVYSGIETHLEQIRDWEWILNGF